MQNSPDKPLATGDTVPQSLRILHTSDWHLGRSLHGRKRYAEFEAFLGWLSETLTREAVDVLLVAGDIFDNGTPSNRAQELYYQFLGRAAATGCRHVVIVAGNHDSPTFLDAPRQLLRALDVHVVGSSSPDNPADEVLVLHDPRGRAELIVCAVPFLRDRDLRQVESGESVADKERKLIEGVHSHYREVAQIALAKRRELGGAVPVVGMGHLFATGGRVVDDDGVRELYVGSLARVDAEVIARDFDYLALGHLHIPQSVTAASPTRYSGSPLPMGFGEAGQPKSVCLVDFRDGQTDIRTLEIPAFQRLERLRGDWPQIAARLQELGRARTSVWLEVFYDSAEVIGDLRSRLDTAVEGTELEVLAVKNTRLVQSVLGQIHADETLDDLDPGDVFERCLETHAVPGDQREGLRAAYREIMQQINDVDERAE